MGEIADLVLDGVICQQCGCFIGDPAGYPRDCEDCEEENQQTLVPKKR